MTPMLWRYGLVFVLTFFIGGLAIGVGLLVDLSPGEAFLTAVVSSLAYMVVALYGGGWLRDRLFGAAMSRLEERVSESRASDLLDRWGVPGLALVGSALLGPTLTLMAALVLGVDRRRFAVWYTVATLVAFAVFTLLWSALL